MSFLPSIPCREIQGHCESTSQRIRWRAVRHQMLISGLHVHTHVCMLAHTTHIYKPKKTQLCEQLVEKLALN